MGQKEGETRRRERKGEGTGLIQRSRMDVWHTRVQAKRKIAVNVVKIARKRKGVVTGKERRRRERGEGWWGGGINMQTGMNESE